MKRGIIIQASSRSMGNTFKVVSLLKEQLGFDTVDLSQKHIKHYDYEFNNQDDDFNALFKELASTYEIWIMITPIYWYTMSGHLKVFLDRISDFLKREKDFGRLLRGKLLGSISVSENDEIFEGFSMPFEQSARYLGMHYLGHLHTYVENGTITEKIKYNLKAYSQNINSTVKE